MLLVCVCVVAFGRGLSSPGTVYNSYGSLMYNYYSTSAPVCTVSVPPNVTNSTGVVASFTPGPGYDFRQCLGFYTFTLNAVTGTRSNTEERTRKSLRVACNAVAAAAVVVVTCGTRLRQRYVSPLGSPGCFWFVWNRAADVCPASRDTISVSVTCPTPPLVSVLLNVNLQWNGKQFVSGTSSDSTYKNWVQVCALGGRRW